MPDGREEEKQVLRWVKLEEWTTPEGRALVESIYREQAARHVQRFLRKKRKLTSKAEAYPATESDSILQVMQEPTGDRYKDHVAKIKANQFIDLDFKDPEFVRNIYKCLRLGEIDLNQLDFALQIYHAYQWLKPEGKGLHTFRYNDPKGPYQLKKEISYSTPEQINQFYRSVTAPEDQQYATINFSKFNEYCFFRSNLEQSQSNLLKSVKFQQALRCYVKQFLNPSELKSFEKSLKNGTNDGVFGIMNQYSSQDELLKIINQYNAKHESVYLKSTSNSFGLLASILNLTEENPCYQLSPDYRDADSKSPVLCFILPTMNSENALQDAVHGEHTTHLRPVAGAINNRMLRAMDERSQEPMRPVREDTAPLLPNQTVTQEEKLVLSEQHGTHDQVSRALYRHQYDLITKNARSIELTHPDIKKTKSPHGYNVHDFMLTWHDRFHTWRNSSHIKMAIQHLRKLLSHRGICQDRDFIMTKAIFELTDMDFPFGSRIRSMPDRPEEFSLLSEIFNWLMTGVGLINENSDLFMLVFIDMIRHAEKWDSFVAQTGFGFTLEEIIMQNAAVAGAPLNILFGDAKLVLAVKALPEDKSNESLILRTKLRAIPSSNALCDLADVVGLEKMFRWASNSGLHTKKELENDLQHFFGTKRIVLDELHNPLDIAAVIFVGIRRFANAEQCSAFLNSEAGNVFLESLLDSGQVNLLKVICDENKTLNLGFRVTNFLAFLKNPVLADKQSYDKEDSDLCLAFLSKNDLDVKLLRKIIMSDVSDGVKRAVLHHPNWREENTMELISDSSTPYKLIKLIAQETADNVAIQQAITPSSTELRLMLLRNRKAMVPFVQLEQAVERNRFPGPEDYRVKFEFKYHPYNKLRDNSASHFEKLQMARCTSDVRVLFSLLEQDKLSDDIKIAVVENKFSDGNVLHRLMSLKDNTPPVLIAIAKKSNWETVKCRQEMLSILRDTTIDPQPVSAALEFFSSKNSKMLEKIKQLESCTSLDKLKETLNALIALDDGRYKMRLERCSNLLIQQKMVDKRP